MRPQVPLRQVASLTQPRAGQLARWSSWRPRNTLPGRGPWRGRNGHATLGDGQGCTRASYSLRSRAQPSDEQGLNCQFAQPCRCVGMWKLAGR